MWEQQAEPHLHLTVEHPSPVQIEVGSSPSACNDAVKSLLAKQTLWGGGMKKNSLSIFFDTKLINAKNKK